MLLTTSYVIVSHSSVFAQPCIQYFGSFSMSQVYHYIIRLNNAN